MIAVKDHLTSVVTQSGGENNAREDKGKIPEIWLKCRGRAAHLYGLLLTHGRFGHQEGRSAPKCGQVYKPVARSM